MAQILDHLPREFQGPNITKPILHLLMMLIVSGHAEYGIISSHHYSDVIMNAMTFQFSGVSIAYSIVCSGADQRKHKSSASLAFVRSIHRRPVNSPHKGPVTRKMFPFDDVIMMIFFWWRIQREHDVYHYDDVIMTMLASQITSLTVVYSIVYSGVDQSKHQSSASLAFVQEIHRGPVNFPHKWPVTRKMFSFDDVIMWYQDISNNHADPSVTIKTYIKQYASCWQ